MVAADWEYVGSRVSNLTNDAAGGLTATRHYDGTGWTTRLTWTSSAGTTLPDLEYAHDKAGNILTKTHDHRNGDPIE